MKRLFLPVFLLLGIAFAVTYRVDPSGGSDSLAEEVAAAFAAWLELDDSLSAELDENATTRFAYAEDALLGPDTVSLSLRRQNPDEVDVLLDPNATERSSALLHEAGLLLGLGVRGEGVMNPALGETPRSLDEEAAELLEELSALDEDLNFDGTVDFYDLAELAQSFGQSGVGLGADINGDGVVDESDVERLRAAYSFSPPSLTPPGEEDDLLTDDPFGENEFDEAEDLAGERSGEPDEVDPSEPPDEGEEDTDETEPTESESNSPDPTEADGADPSDTGDETADPPSNDP